MKRIKAILTLVLVITICAGCASPGAKIVKEDDGYYLLVKTPPVSKEDYASQVIAPYIIFDTIEEMLDAIRTGNFTDQEIEQLVRFECDEQGRVILFDLDNVLEPIFPPNYDKIFITWSGSRYSFSGKDTTIPSGADTFKITSEGANAKATERYKNLDQYITCDSVTIENRDGIQVTVYDYTVDDKPVARPRRTCTYTLSDTDTELFICESYDSNIDLQTPEYISVYGKAGDVYFRVYVTAFTSRPSPEWLLCFDIKPYNSR